MSSNQKGGDFEREVCKKLSLWWTGGERDDVFWRTSGSGARATVRAKSKLTTANSYGDINAIDPIGNGLLDLVTIEVKRGYKEATLANTLDKPDSAKQQEWEGFIEQARNSAKDGDSPWWWLIAKRDRKKALLFMPHRLLKKLPNRSRIQLPRAIVWFDLHLKQGGKVPIVAAVVDFEGFLAQITPQEFMTYAQNNR